jgi:hypothetical protein
MSRKRDFFTTRQVAEIVGISRATLQEWIATKQVEAPSLPAPGLGVRLWSEADVRRVKAYAQTFYRKGRGGTGKTVVKFEESVWKLNEKRRELTDGARTFQYHPVGTYPEGQKSKIRPVTWFQKIGREFVEVHDEKLKLFLNQLFRFIFGRLQN